MRIFRILAVTALAIGGSMKGAPAQTPSPAASQTSSQEGMQKAYEAYNRADYGTAMKLFRVAADQGNAEAQFVLGIMYANGTGVRRDYATAMAWYRKASDQGYARAQTNIGMMYEAGQGVKRDYATAMSWFQKAADKGEVTAEVGIAKMYLGGEGIKQDFVKAMVWLRKAAEPGVGTELGLPAAQVTGLNAAAQYQIGILYENGLGVPSDAATAKEWFSKSAALGNKGAKEKLSQLQDSTSASVEKGSAADNADAQAAFRYLKQKLTIDVSMVGRPEPGLARFQSVEGNICRLRCGYHIAVSLKDVADLDFEFSMSDVALSTLRWEIDRDNRAFINFASTAGTPLFKGRGRSRKVDLFSFDQKPLSAWTKWSVWKKVEKGFCRSRPDKADLDRALRAFSVLATACGAHQTPF